MHSHISWLLLKCDPTETIKWTRPRWLAAREQAALSVGAIRCYPKTSHTIVNAQVKWKWSLVRQLLPSSTCFASFQQFSYTRRCSLGNRHCDSHCYLGGTAMFLWTWSDSPCSPPFSSRKISPKKSYFPVPNSTLSDLWAPLYLIFVCFNQFLFLVNCFYWVIYRNSELLPSSYSPFTS